MRLLNRLISLWQWRGFKKELRKEMDEVWNDSQRIRLMNPEERECEIKRTQALRFVGDSLNKSSPFYAKSDYLRKVVVRDFNILAPESEQFPQNLRPNQLRKIISARAKQYHIDKNSLLITLADSFVEQMKIGLGERGRLYEKRLLPELYNSIMQFVRELSPDDTRKAVTRFNLIYRTRPSSIIPTHLSDQDFLLTVKQLALQYLEIEDRKIVVFENQLRLVHEKNMAQSSSPT